MYEQCDTTGNPMDNPLASVRSAQRVLCCWKTELNRVPPPEELEGAHAWFDSGWDCVRKRVTSLSICVDSPASGAVEPRCFAQSAAHLRTRTPLQLATRPSAPARSASLHLVSALLPQPRQSSFLSTASL